MKCPTFERLIDYLDNRLPQPEALSLANHLATGCAACEETRGWYERVRAVATSDDSVAPPQWAFKRAVRIFDKRLQRPNLAERIAQGFAELVFDSFSRPAMAGVRSTDIATRQLLYSAGDYGIDLRIAPFHQNTRADLMGQVLKESDPTFESVFGLKLEITRTEGEVILSTVTDEMGEFKFSGVERGLYNLRVEFLEGSITVHDLPVNES